MKTTLNISIMKRLGVICLLLVISVAGKSQKDIGRQTILQFSPNHHVLQPDAEPLKSNVPMKLSHMMPIFLSGVGGLSFDQVAAPVHDLSIKDIALHYNPLKEDGHRFELTINHKAVIVFIPNWILVPVARYAESPDYSCVTLFGKIHDKALETAVVNNEGRIINYHPAFFNTLMGVRLAYMDMLVGYPFTYDLPRDSFGRYILGLGESEPDTDDTKLGLYYLSQHLIKVSNSRKEIFRSYVISDYNQPVVFSVEHDTLKLTGSPYYYCWLFNGDRKEYDINKKAKELAAGYTNEIKRIKEIQGQKAAQEWVYEKFIALSKEYDGRYDFYSKGTLTDLIKINGDAEKLAFLKRFAPESIIDLMIETSVYMDRDSVIFLKAFSDDISSKPELFQEANPAVWHATLNTMQYAAFFRFVKQNYPGAWQQFIKQLEQVDPHPGIKTPTVMYNPTNKAIKPHVQKYLKK